MVTKKSHILQQTCNKAAGLFKYVWPFCYHQALKGWRDNWYILIEFSFSKPRAPLLYQNSTVKVLELQILKSSGLIFFHNFDPGPSLGVFREGPPTPDPDHLYCAGTKKSWAILRTLICSTEDGSTWMCEIKEQIPQLVLLYCGRTVKSSH